MQITHKLIALSFAVLTISWAATAQAGTLAGSWVATDADSPVQRVVFDSVEPGEYMSSALLQGDCWQCGPEERKYYLYQSAIMILPVGKQNGDAEYAEFKLAGDNLLLGKLEYRRPPEVCQPPFNCRWEVFEVVELELVREAVR